MKAKIFKNKSQKSGFTVFNSHLKSLKRTTTYQRPTKMMETITKDSYSSISNLLRISNFCLRNKVSEGQLCDDTKLFQIPKQKVQHFISYAMRRKAGQFFCDEKPWSMDQLRLRGHSNNTC